MIFSSDNDNHYNDLDIVTREKSSQPIGHEKRTNPESSTIQYIQNNLEFPMYYIKLCIMDGVGDLNTEKYIVTFVSNIPVDMLQWNIQTWYKEK